MSLAAVAAAAATTTETTSSDNTDAAVASSEHIGRGALCVLEPVLDEANGATVRKTRRRRHSEEIFGQATGRA